jgi:hypothetical protein
MSTTSVHAVLHSLPTLSFISVSLCLCLRRWAYVLDGQGSVLARHGPLPDPIISLAWTSAARPTPGAHASPVMGGTADQRQCSSDSGNSRGSSRGHCSFQAGAIGAVLLGLTRSGLHVWTDDAQQIGLVTPQAHEPRPLEPFTALAAAPGVPLVAASAGKQVCGENGDRDLPSGIAWGSVISEHLLP